MDVIKNFLKDLFIKLTFPIKLRKAVPVLIYQMGKVSSSSIYHPLKKSYPGLVIHIHQFNEHCYFWEAREIYSYFKSGKQTTFKIISLIREPIGRNVSEFFHRFKMYAGVEFKENNLTLTQIREKFLSQIDHDYPLDWFDLNIKDHFGLDVYEKPFSKVGYDYYKNNQIEMLVMKHDLDDDLKNNLIAKFLNIEQFKQEKRNVGESKEYRITYSEFRNTVKLPNDYLDKMRYSKYFKHFYSTEYIENVLSKWKQENV